MIVHFVLLTLATTLAKCGNGNGIIGVDIDNGYNGVIVPGDGYATAPESIVVPAAPGPYVISAPLAPPAPPLPAYSVVYRGPTVFSSDSYPTPVEPPPAVVEVGSTISELPPYKLRSKATMKRRYFRNRNRQRKVALKNTKLTRKFKKLRTKHV